MVKWDFYEKRRNTNLVDFIKINNIEDYDQLVTWCHSREIEPPGLGRFQSAHAVMLPPVSVVSNKKITKAKKPVKDPVSKPKPKRKYVRKKKTT